MPRAPRPVLITDAATPYADQLAARKRRYTVLMSSRLALMVLAALTYSLSVWVAVAMLALSIPLPWMAVLIANDAPPRRTEDAHRLTAPGPRRALTGPDRPVVDLGVDRDHDVDHDHAVDRSWDVDPGHSFDRGHGFGHGRDVDHSRDVDGSHASDHSRAFDHSRGFDHSRAFDHSGKDVDLDTDHAA